MYKYILALLCPLQLLAQGVSNIWIMGYDTIGNQYTGRTILNFQPTGLTVNYTSQVPLDFNRTSATIADNAGNLLFYTNGFTVCNALGDTMPNGAGLDSSPYYAGWYTLGQPSPQAALILPYPSHPDSFYLFHQTVYYVAWPNVATLVPFELYYSIINMQLDSGKGDIIEKEISFLQDTIQNGRLTACKHANGRDWWLVTREAYSDMFYTFLITPSGISPPITQHIGSVLWPPDIGQVCFSPQGTKYALVDHFNHLRLYDFDRCTGIFSNPIYIPILDSAIARGLAFSSSGRYLYVASDLFLYQFDTWAANIGATMDTIAVWDGFYSPSPPFAASFYTLQLAPDGKIYFVAPNSVKVIHKIDYPDSAGIACGVCQHCVQTPTYYGYTVPNHPNYFLGAEVGSVCDSLTVITENNYPPQALLKLYPNPANTFFWLDYDLSNSTANGELLIYNTLGEIVLHKTLYNYFKTSKIDCSTLAQGIYYLSIQQGSKKVGSGKFVKQ